MTMIRASRVIAGDFIVWGRQRHEVEDVSKDRKRVRITFLAQGIYTTVEYRPNHMLEIES